MYFNIENIADNPKVANVFAIRANTPIGANFFEKIYRKKQFVMQNEF